MPIDITGADIANAAALASAAARPKPPTVEHTESARPPKFTKENMVAGKTLNNYVDREPDEDGKYVVVTTHTEHIELIEQPLTAEEKAEIKAKQEAERKFATKILAGVAVVCVGIVGWVSYLDKQNRTIEVTAPAAPEVSA